MGYGGSLSLDAFKQMLLLANKKGLVQLSRADLVGAMDRELVNKSEINIDNTGNITDREHSWTSLHFINNIK